MPFQGSLRDFGIVEILQLLAAQEKTGTLRVNGDLGQHALVFDAGQIISAWDPHAASRDPFREFLVRREIVPRDAMRRVLKAETTSPHSFAEILLRLRIVDHEEIQEAFAEHVQERVEDLIGWRNGSFEFFQQESVVPYAPGILMKTEGLLMEAARRADELAANPQAREVEAPATDVAVAPPRASLATILAHVTLLAVILTGSLVGFWWYAPLPDGVRVRGPVEHVLERVESVRQDRGLVALRCSLELFRQMHGRYPAGLDDLSTQGLVENEDLRALRDLDLHYAPLDEGRAYRLESREDSDIVRRAPIGS